MSDTGKKILLVDDEEKLLNSMAQRLELLGFETVKTSSGVKALEIAKTTHFDMAIVDFKMPDMDGLVTITKLKEISPDLKTVLLTGYGNEKIKQATEAIGSLYFEKDSMGDLWTLIKRSSHQGHVVVIKPPSSAAQFSNKSKNQGQTPGRIEIMHDHDDHSFKLQHAKDTTGSLEGRFNDPQKIIGEIPEMQRLRKNIERLSQLDCSIIIRGETGTGRELAARLIHKLSARRNQRFIAFDCGCFSSEFLFNELVGSIETSTVHHGANRAGDIQRRVVFAGTILLDHIENMPQQAQQQMMAIIDNKKAASSTKSGESIMDIRFVVSTDKDLKKIVEKGKIEKALLNRINAIEISIPPLRERKDDISQLCRYYTAVFNKEFKKNIEAFSDEVVSIFNSYSFPGNIRELKHIIERAVILTDGPMIEAKHLPERIRETDLIPQQVGSNKVLSLNEMEKLHILKAIEATQGNKSKAAELLGISRAALWRKLKLINTET